MWNSEILDFQIGHFLTHFLGPFLVFSCPYWPKGRKTAIFDQFCHTHVCNSRFFGPLKVDLLDAKGHFSCFSKKVSFMGGGKKKVVFHIFCFRSKKSTNLLFLGYSSWFFGHFLDLKFCVQMVNKGIQISQMRIFRIWKIVKFWNLGF